MKKLYLVFLIFIYATGVGLASIRPIEDPKKPKPSSEEPLKVNLNGEGSLSEQVSAAANKYLNQRLNGSLTGYKQTQNMNVVAVDNMLDLKENIAEETANTRGKAKGLMNYLDSHQDKLREELQWDDLVVLPVGLKKKVSDNSTLTIGILKVDFKPTYAELTVFIRLVTPINNPNSTEKFRELFFGVEGLKFTKQAGLSAEDFKAVLLGDYLIPHKDWTIKLKGGIDASITPADEDPYRCYIKFDCGRFKEINLAADIIIPRSVLLPCTDDGEVITNANTRVQITNLRALVTGGLRDVIFESGNITPFAFPKNPEYAFKVSNLAFDMSDNANPTSLSFPVGYEGDTDAKWQGLSINAFEIIIPEEFEEKDTEGRIRIAGNNILVDRTGFSGYVSALNLNKKANIKKWTLSLNNFEVRFLQNRFISGSFDGVLETSIHKPNEAPEKQFGYRASIYLGVPSTEEELARSQYSITVNTQTDMPLNLFFAKATIYEGSLVELTLTKAPGAKYKFEAAAVLSGVMQIGAAKGGDNIGEHQANRTIDLGEVEFRKLRIQTSHPYVSVAEFAYNKGENNFINNFPVQLTQFERYKGQIAGLPPVEGVDVWTQVGFKLDLFKGKITGASNFIIRSKYNDADGKIRPEGITFRRVAVRGEISPVIFDGFVDVNEDETKKEISGRLMVSITEPNPFMAKVSVLFGRKKTGTPYKYGYVDGMFEMAGGIPIFPGVDLYGGGLGLYWNMRPRFTSTIDPTDVDCASTLDEQRSLLKYCRDPAVKFGVKMMASIKNHDPSGVSGKSAFKVRAFLDIVVNDNFGIDYVALYGNGVIGGDFKPDPAKTPEQDEKEYAQKVVGASIVASGGAATNNQVANKEKSDKINEIVNGSGKKMPSFADKNPITFSAGMMLDRPNKLFHMEAEAYIKSASFSGIGIDGSVGKAEIHFQTGGKNYIHIGKAQKDQRMGLKFGELARFDSYLMLGDGVPQFPAPDPEVVAFFPGLAGRFSGPVCSDVSSGKAFAFGASARLGIQEEGRLWYLKAQAFAGLDVLVAKRDGLDNWQGQGQLYALVQTRMGARVAGKNVQILDMGLGLYAYIQVPKPFGLDADLCVSVPRWISKHRTKCIGVSMGETSGFGGVNACSN